MGCLKNHSFARVLLTNRNIIIILCLPLLLLPIPMCTPTPAGKCGYVVLIMMAFLVSEALPMPITAMIPLFAFPLLGIQDYPMVARNYASDTMLFILSVMIVALPVERTNLHRRIVFRCLLMFGSNPYRVLIGLMCSGFFLSMWIPNVAVIAMMMPIATGIIEETAKEQSITKCKHNNIAYDVCSSDAEVIDMDNNTCSNSEVVAKTNSDTYPAGKYMSLGLLYSVALGGSATLIGTVIPQVANGMLLVKYGNESIISYRKWLIFALPLELLCLIFTYLWVTFLMWLVTRKYRNRNTPEKEEGCVNTDVNEVLTTTNDKDEGEQLNTGVYAYMKQESMKLGPIRWAEIITFVMIGILTLLWCCADLGDVGGWFAWFPKGYLSLTTITSLFAVLFFIIPQNFKQFSETSKETEYKAILDWNYVTKMIPWNVLIVVGGYIAVSSGIKSTNALAGFADVLAKSTVDVDVWKIVLLSTILATLCTEFIGNIVIVSVFFQIVTLMADVKSVHPHYLIMPVVYAANMSLMLPIASPPNLLFYAFKVTKISDMIKTGWMVNLISIFLVNILINTYGYYILGIGTMPSWAQPDEVSTTISTNVTITAIESFTYM